MFLNVYTFLKQKILLNKNKKNFKISKSCNPTTPTHLPSTPPPPHPAWVVGELGNN
jgi:hypothetical protein